MAKKTYDSLFMLHDVVNRPSERPTPRSNSSSSSKRPATTLFGTMSSFDVMRAKDDCLAFNGEWEDFLGQPEKNFYMILSAQPGYGKSTLALKFANYLATHFGKTIYFTNEENPSRIRRKLEFLGDKMAKFDINFTAKSPAEINRMVQAGGYKFVFIDSAQNCGMNYKELWDFHESHPDTALIAIARQTKSGHIRGSQNSEYDGDITITFPKQGTAQTIKNRFNDLKQYVVF